MGCKPCCMVGDIERIIPIDLHWKGQCYVLTRYGLAPSHDKRMSEIGHAVRDTPIRATRRNVERCRSGIKKNSVWDNGGMIRIHSDQYTKQCYEHEKEKEAAENKHSEMCDQEFLLHGRHSFIKNDQVRR